MQKSELLLAPIEHIDLAAFDPRPLDGLGDGQGGQRVRPRVLELSLVRAGERGSHRAGNHDSTGHVSSPRLEDLQAFKLFI